MGLVTDNVPKNADHHNNF